MLSIRGVRNHPPDHLVLQARLLISPTESVHHYGGGVGGWGTGKKSNFARGQRGDWEIADAFGDGTRTWHGR